MDLGGPGKICSRIRSTVRIVFPLGLAAFVILAGCSHDSGSRIRVELRDAPEAKLANQEDFPSYSCPEADHGDIDPKMASPEGHKVKLSWNLSTSSYGPNGKNVFYCVYRTKDGAVQETNPKSAYACANCQRVTAYAVQATTTTDVHVEDRAHYCYVAIAIDVSKKSDISNKNFSGFSNQAPAVIPPATDLPFCGEKAAKQAATKKDRSHH